MSPVVIRAAPFEAASSAPARRYVFSPDLVTISEPLSSSAESMRSLRTHILAQHVQAGRRALAVCAPSEGVGCTFVAANLAVALAQVGIKTLLVDANLRNPGLDDLFQGDPPGEGGLSGCLARPGARVGDHVDADVLPNLSIFRAGPASSNAQELLATDWFERVINFCLRDHDITILDTPPANLYADVRRVSTVAGYSLIVARRHKSLLADVRTLSAQIQTANGAVIGAVLNA